MSDFRLKVIAETQAAESSLKQVDKVATEATRDRNLKIEIPNYSDLSKNFRDLNKDIGSAANGIKDFYKVASKLPVGPISDINQLAGQLKKVAVTATDTSRNVGDAGDVIKSTFNATNRAAETLVSRLTKIALSLYVVKEAAGLVQGAFGGLFNETIGREIKLRETILKTQTTLASTNKVFKNGKEITDPYQKIVTLTGAVRKNIDSIRERSIALAGVTSGEVIEVFGMVASQVGQIGGGLKEAEDLAINFAAALGTFGIPLYQARQEIGSILRGDITTDSYLAKALGITNEDIAKAKTQTGGVVKFLEERLAASVAGQRIAAEGFSGVVSNIKDLSELINQSFGAGLLDPLLDGLTKVFNFLFNIRSELFAIAELAGRSIGAVLSIGSGMTTGASAVSKDPGAKAAKTLSATESGINAISLKITAAIQGVYLQMATLAERASAAFAAITKGLAALAYGLLSIKLEALKALISVVESLSPALLVAANAVGGLLTAWGGFMQIPVVQFIAQISTGMRVLAATGVTGLISSLLILKGVIAWVQANIPKIITHFNSIRAMIGGVIAAIGSLIVNTTRAGTAMLAAWQPQSRALQALKAELTQVSAQLNLVGSNAQAAGQKLGSLRNTGGQLGGGIVSLIGNMVKFQLIMFAITATISLVANIFGKWKESQDRLASEKRAEEALKRLNTTYKDVGEAASGATKRAKEFEQAIVNTQYEAAFANLKKLEAELKGINELLDRKNKTTVFDDLKAGTEALITDLGKVWGLMQLIAGAKSPKDVKPDDNKIFGFDTRNLSNEGRREILLEEEKKARAEVNKWASADELERRKENVKLIANKQIDLSKEYAELERQQQNDLFQQRQTLAQKEVEIFRAAGELRIFQMEQANAKLIEGEEGASRTALEALNNYLSVRENGELEIEAAKKDIVIEVANLEKTIADYRFENEKKIAELRKRAGQNEMAMADARRQADGQRPPVAGGGAFDTGLRTGPSNVIGGSAPYHQDLSFGPGVDLRQQRELMVDLAKSYDNMGRKIVLSNEGVHGREFPLSGTVEQQNKFITDAQAAHRNRPGGGRTAIDFYTPNKDDPRGINGRSVENAAMYAPQVVGGKTNYFAGGAGGAGVEITKEGQSILKLIHGRTDIKLPQGGNVPGASTLATRPAATPTPALQSLDVAGPSIEAVTASMQKLNSAFERQRQLAEDLTNAQSVAAFERIAKEAFPEVQLEGYLDSLAEAELTYEAITSAAAGAFNPELSALAIRTNVEIARSNTELAQIIEETSKREKLSAIEKKKLIDQATAAQAKLANGLRQAEAIQASTLVVQRAGSFVAQLKGETAAIYDNLEVLKIRNQRQFEGVDPAIIAGQEALLLLQRKINIETNLVNELLAKEYAARDLLQKQVAAADAAALPALQKKLDDALARIASFEGERTDIQATGFDQANAINAQTAAETEPGAKIRAFIGDGKRELDDLEAVAIRVSQGIGDAVGSSLANGITGLIEGTTSAKEVFATFLSDIGQMLIQEGTKMIAMYIAIGIAKIFAGMAGGGGGDSAAKLGSNPNMAKYAPLPGAANGATFANGIATFANGGTFSNSIVSSPTLFKFADGGTTKTGLMGEAGPEAIMPLKRGSDGSLGVQASGLREAMGAAPGSTGGGAPVLNMSFQSSTINGVEYVSRDQLEQAMAQTRKQASRDGANRGMTMTLDKLQQSPSTRSRVGMR